MTQSRLSFFLFPIALWTCLAASSSCTSDRSPARDLPSYLPDPAVPSILLPSRFTSHRVNSNRRIPREGYVDVANLRGPGSVRHIWFLPGDRVRLVIQVDGSPVPQVDMPLASFFGVLHGLPPYPIDAAAYTVLPNPLPDMPGTPGYNLFLPIPFSDSCRIMLQGPEGERAVAMVDWHAYDAPVTLTPYRLFATRRLFQPAPPRGLGVEIEDAAGEGFVAGIVAGYIQRDHTDMVFHTGGMTLLLDGETDPHVIRGHNVEDDFGFTWGFNDRQSRWIGCPYHVNRGRLDQDGVFYRFFGPDPIAFRSSLVFRTGSRGDDMETVVYTYRIPGAAAPEIESPAQWQVSGPFPNAGTPEGFLRSEFVERLEPGNWPDTLRDGESKVAVQTLPSKRGWIDLQSIFFERSHTATPLTMLDHSAYLRSTILSNQERTTTLRLAFDDRVIVWLNGEKLATLWHENGLGTARLPIRLRSGSNYLLVKTGNTDGPPNNRQWVLHVAVVD